jgi:LysM repeat protein
MPRIRPARHGWRPLAAVAALALAASAGYTVRPGDNLTRIAARHGTTVGAIASLNGIANPDRILAGQTLQLPAGARPAAGGGLVHTVQRGETLSGIAVRYGVPSRTIAQANGLADPKHPR